MSGRRFDTPAVDARHCDVAVEGHAVCLGKPGCDLWNGSTGFHAKIDRAVKDRTIIGDGEHRPVVACPYAVEKRTAIRHLGAEEAFEDTDTFGSPRRHQQPRLQDWDAGFCG